MHKDKISKKTEGIAWEAYSQTFDLIEKTDDESVGVTILLTLYSTIMSVIAIRLAKGRDKPTPKAAMHACKEKFVDGITDLIYKHLDEKFIKEIREIK